MLLKNRGIAAFSRMPICLNKLIGRPAVLANDVALGVPLNVIFYSINEMSEEFYDRNR